MEGPDCKRIHSCCCEVCRTQAIRQRLELLAGSMAVEICDFALMDNHIHLVLRTRPDVARSWSDQEVVARWWQLCPTRVNERGSAAEPYPCELNLWLADPKKITELCRRLVSISWFMRLLCQKVARWANQEDQVTGKFWESRFKCQALLDEQAVLACSMYVDLNPIRAGKAQTPEESQYTSAYERIEALKRQRTRCKQESGTSHAEESGASVEPGADRITECDLWLCPIELPARGGLSGSDGSPEQSQPRPVPGGDLCLANAFPARRLSNKGFLPMPLERYLELLDWTGRQMRSDKRGSIPAELAGILERLRINSTAFPDTVKSFSNWFGSAVGRLDSMAERASRMGRRWLQGKRQSALAFR